MAATTPRGTCGRGRRHKEQLRSAGDLRPTPVTYGAFGLVTGSKPRPLPCSRRALYICTGAAGVALRRVPPRLSASRCALYFICTGAMGSSPARGSTLQASKPVLVPYQLDMIPRWRPATFTLVSTPSGACHSLTLAEVGESLYSSDPPAGLASASAWEPKSRCLMAAGDLGVCGWLAPATVPPDSRG